MGASSARKKVEKSDLDRLTVAGRRPGAYNPQPALDLKTGDILISRCEDWGWVGMLESNARAKFVGSRGGSNRGVRDYVGKCVRALRTPTASAIADLTEEMISLVLKKNRKKFLTFDL